MRDPFGPDGSVAHMQQMPVPNATANGQVPPQQGSFFNNDLAPIVTVGSWIGTFLILLAVPLVLSILAGILSVFLDFYNPITLVVYLLASFSSIILMFYYAFSRKVNPSKRNMFRASLIMTAITVVLCIVIVVLAVVVVGPVFTDMIGDPEMWMDMFLYY